MDDHTRVAVETSRPSTYSTTARQIVVDARCTDRRFNRNALELENTERRCSENESHDRDAASSFVRLGIQIVASRFGSGIPDQLSFASVSVSTRSRSMRIVRLRARIMTREFDRHCAALIARSVPYARGEKRRAEGVETAGEFGVDSQCRIAPKFQGIGESTDPLRMRYQTRHEEPSAKPNCKPIVPAEDLKHVSSGSPL